MDAGERVKYIVDKLNVSVLGLSRKMSNTSDTRLRHVITGRNKISKKLAQDLVDAIEGLNLDWVLRGEGEPPMYLRFREKMNQAREDIEKYGIKITPNVKEFSNLEPSDIVHDRPNGISFQDLSDGKILMYVPLVDQYAEAGYLAGYRDPEFLDELEKYTVIVDKRHRGVYRAFVAKGDSMDNGLSDAIQSGDQLLGRKIEKEFWNSRFHLHDWKDYIIVHKDGIIAKRIIKHDVENGSVTIHSLNPNKELYPDIEINLEDVLEIYNIIEVKKSRRW